MTKNVHMHNFKCVFVGHLLLEEFQGDVWDDDVVDDE